MTLHIDNQAGSKPLIRLAKKITSPGTVKSGRYDTGDAHWTGSDDKTYCVEVKHLSDVLKCIGDGRFVSQLRRMQSKFDHYYLLLVDEFRCTSGGELEYLKVLGKRVKIKRWFKPYASNRGAVTYAGLVSWLTTMELLGGCHLWHVQSDEQAANWIVAKYKWSQKKAEQHKSLNVFDTSRPAPRRDKKTGVKFIGKPNEIACVANALVRGLGWEKSKALGRHFSSPDEFWRASEDELMEVRGIGEELAGRIVAARAKRINAGKKVKKAGKK